MSFLESQPLIISANGKRLDYDIIINMVQDGSRVLDLGCGSGELMERLIRERHVLARGVDLHQPSVSECISKGLSVYHGDIHEGLADLRDNSFDYVILSRTLQQVPDPETVIREMLRVGKYAIVSFPNFAFWRIRLHLLCHGTLPMSPALPYAWYNTPNIRLITMADFVDFCQKKGFAILETAGLDTDNAKHQRQVRHLISWRAEYGIFLLEKKSGL
ncbi:MAG TPA: methionine biosynthesis protein MetW [Armatimonadota bacterium]|nr:methionine biosynthesis protein MetW [Armatimonadota bacterium]